MPLAERAPAQEYDAPDWISAGETARKLGLHIETLYLALKRGQMPFDAVKVGGSWRIRRADVDRHIAWRAGEA